MANTSSFLATRMDEEMLTERHIHPARPNLDVNLLPLKTGLQVFDELGGRYLIRYLTDLQYGRFTGGDTGRHYTTPTPYPMNELNRWLALRDPREKRPWLLLLDPRKVLEIRGPQWVAGPGGIQYILPNGFPEDAIVVPGAPRAHWELELA